MIKVKESLDKMLKDWAESGDIYDPRPNIELTDKEIYILSTEVSIGHHLHNSLLNLMDGNLDYVSYGAVRITRK